MKTIALIITAVALSIASYAQVNPNSTYVNGYHKSNGTYVKGHYRTKPNYTNRDNYSTKPNVNPYTGKKGYNQPDNNYYYNSTQKSNNVSYPSYNSTGTKTKKTTYTTWPY